MLSFSLDSRILWAPKNEVLLQNKKDELKRLHLKELTSVEVCKPKKGKPRKLMFSFFSFGVSCSNSKQREVKHMHIKRISYHLDDGSFS